MDIPQPIIIMLEAVVQLHQIVQDIVVKDIQDGITANVEQIQIIIIIVQIQTQIMEMDIIIMVSNNDLYILLHIMIIMVDCIIDILFTLIHKITTINNIPPNHLLTQIIITIKIMAKSEE